jgi:hypothetical protein
MDESLNFFIEGISVTLLLGDRQTETILTLRHLGYLIFNEIRSLYATLPPYNLFPPELNKFKTRFAIGSLISTKKVRFSVQQQQQPQAQRRSPSQQQRPPHPVLGVIITKTSPYSDLLYNAIHFVCVKHNTRLNIFGTATERISLSLHERPQDVTELHSLARTIGTSHSPLHNINNFKIIRDVPIHPHILEKQHYLHRAINNFGSCYGILYDFSHGFGKPHLTCIFSANRESSYFSIEHVQSRIIEVNEHEINLRPTHFTHPPIAHSLRSPPPFLPPSPPGRGRVRGTTSSHTRTPQQSFDRSASLFRIINTSPLGLQPKFTHKFYVIINGVGGIAVANVFQLNFNDEGIRARVSNVPFCSHKSFPTEIEAWQYFTSYYPHIKSPSDAQHMNENCPIEASNLNNPSRRFQEVSGLTFNIPRNTNEFFHFDDLPATIQATRRDASERMYQLGLTPIDDFTFLAPQQNAPTTSPPTVSPFHPPSVIDRACDDSIHAESMSLLSNTAIDEDMSSHASNLNLNTQPITTFNAQTTPANKRARSNTSQPQSDEPTYIYLTVPINESYSTTHTNLQRTLSTAKLPPSLLSSPLRAWTSHSASNTHEKLIFVQLHDTSHNNQVLRAIRNLIPLSMPQLSSTLPPTTTIDDVDLSPQSSETFQRFCRITTCPYHYGGDDFFLNDETGLLDAELHGNNIHQSILTSLSSNTLSSIGWQRCCDVCPALFLSTDGLSHHQSLCSNFTTTITTTTTPTPQIDGISQTVKDKLYFLCPTSRHNELTSLIATTPDANPKTLFEQVTSWFLESKYPATSPASPNTLE